MMRGAADRYHRIIGISGRTPKNRKRDDRQRLESEACLAGICNPADVDRMIIIQKGTP